jgi:sirohydrochlorin cobaltochelatase
VNGSTREFLREFPCCIGEIAILRGDAGEFFLTHRDEQSRDRAGLQLLVGAEAAVALARSDDAGNFRPLKTAPNLRHGWCLQLPDEREVERAIDFFYPARLAAFRAWRAGELRMTPLRETLERQSGMYRVAAKITDSQADQLVGSFCRSDGGCLRTILWRRDAAGTLPSTLLPKGKFDPAVDQMGRGEKVVPPLLCQEACNLLVAAAREVVKVTPKL